MLASLVGFSAIGDQIGSHLLGAFVAGMCFTKVPLSHHIWVQQMKRILRWLIRIFFAATVGFAIPVSTMLTVSAFLKGLAIGPIVWKNPQALGPCDPNAHFALSPK